MARWRVNNEQHSQVRVLCPYTWIIFSNKYDHNSYQAFSLLIPNSRARTGLRIRGQLRALLAISCISYDLLYDWPSHFREQIKRTFQFRGCHGKFLYVSFYVSMEITIKHFRSMETGYTQKRPCPWANAYLPMSKRASVTTAVVPNQSLKPRLRVVTLLETRHFSRATLWWSMFCVCFGDWALNCDWSL